MKNRIILTSVFIFFGAFVFSQTEKSSGTGFFVSEDGIIVTCAHVIEDGTRITVKINNNEYTAQVLVKDASADLALLKIDYRNQFHFKVINFNTAALGDKVFVLGFPLSNLLGSDIRLTDGIISAKSGMNSDQAYFQLSAPIQPGNSGGPIFNNNFDVLGVAAAKLNDMATLRSSGSIPQNINFGVKSGYINPLLGNIRLGRGNIKTMNDAINATVQILCYEASGQSGSSVKIVNKTGYTVYYVYLSPVSSESWGSDRLGASILQNGQTLTVSSLPLNSNNQYDIRLVDEDNDSYTRRNVRLSQNQTIEFTVNDFDGRSTTMGNSNEQSSVRIVNKTGYTVYYVYVSPTSTDKWEEDILGDDVLPNGQSVTVRYPLNSTNRYDIRLEDSDGDTYTKWNILITPNGTVEFTMSDID
jgi:V8-like Glu-specific endopeptidase